MNINFKAPRRLVEEFKAFLHNRISPEDKDLVKRVTESSTKVTDHGLGGYRVQSPIDDAEILEKELDLARNVVENRTNLSDKDEVFRDCLLILMKSIDVKTRKVDSLITELEKLE